MCVSTNIRSNVIYRSQITHERTNRLTGLGRLRRLAPTRLTQTRTRPYKRHMLELKTLTARRPPKIGLPTLAVFAQVSSFRLEREIFLYVAICVRCQTQMHKHAHSCQTLKVTSSLETNKIRRTRRATRIVHVMFVVCSI